MPRNQKSKIRLAIDNMKVNSTLLIRKPKKSTQNNIQKFAKEAGIYVITKTTSSGLRVWRYED
jgi:TusA-related sulfurtransferase